MKTLLFGIGMLALLLPATALWAQQGANPVGPGSLPERTLARDLLRELVEINTTPTYGSTKAAETLAARLRSARFAESDVLLLGPRPDRQNLVVRLPGSGKAKPILLIAHLDTVDAPREGWSEGLDPFRFNETTRAYFARLSMVEKGMVADDMRAVVKDPPDLDAANRVAAASPYYNAILRTTCVATRLEGGHADNALPQSARATVNCRVFPGDTPEFVREALRRPWIRE